MDFSDIGEGELLWCAFCGPDAHALSAILNEALETRGEEFGKKLDAAISWARAEQETKVS
jgi:hypothetical protein